MSRNYAKTMEIYGRRLLIVMILASCITTDLVNGDAMTREQQIPLVRLPSNTLLKYTAYKDVSILHFDIPADTRTAYFNFKAYEETKSAFQRQCKPRDVTLHLKAGSYPVISPENITFPKHFLHADQRFEIYNLQFKSDGMMRRLSIDGPNAGDWFAVAFISWTDPNNDRIEQQGLAASCETLLSSELNVVSAKPIILNADNGLMHNNTLNEPIAAINSQNNRNNTNGNATYNSGGGRSSSSSSSSNTNNSTTNIDKSNSSDRRPINYKFFVPRDVDSVAIHFKILQTCAECPSIAIYVQANALPTPKNFVHSIMIAANKTDETIMEFHPHQNAWHYVEIYFANRERDTHPTMASSTPIAPSSSSSLPPTTKPLKSKFRFEKKLQFAANNSNHIHNNYSNIFVNFSIGIHYTNEMSSAELKQKQSSAENGNKSRDDANAKSNRKIDGNAGFNTSENNRSGGNGSSSGENVDSSSLSDENQRQQRTTTARANNLFDESGNGGDVDDNNSSSSSNNNDDVDDDDDFDTDTDKDGMASTSKLSIRRSRNINYYSLLRQTYREFFMFDYDLLPDENGTVPMFINLTACTTTGFRFNVGGVYDIGGTLSFAVVMKDNLRDASIAAAASSIVKARNRMVNDIAVAEKLVHVNDAELVDGSATGGGEESSSKNNGAGTGIDNMNYELNHSKESSSNDDDGIDNSVARSNQTIIICMHQGEPGIPTWPDKCVYGRHVFPAASIVNNTNDETSTGLVHVPFPEPGMWYVTLGLYCHGAETAARITIIDSVKEFIKKYVHILDDVRTPCACANRTDHYQKCIADARCLDELNESETLKVKECLMDSKCTHRHKEMTRKFEVHHRLATEQSVSADSSSCNASAVFTISSSPCVAGHCSRNGRCFHYMSGGFVFSTCLCVKGYRGWDCTEDSQVPSSFSILLALLLLTLSNLLFIPSIYMAVRRKYFTEGIIYFFAMFFSIFYHACDSGEDEYSFCLVKIGVLQFCDFYCGLLAIWVTLIAMAHIRQQFVSMLHMLGAILLAFGTELNKQSLWVFLAPALTGLCMISVSWGSRCQRTRKLFPSHKYLSIFLPIGTVLVMCGLVCYAFLQTRQNYAIVHSIWHMLMALSILMLLPSRNTFIPKC